MATTSSPSGLNDALVTGFSHGTDATGSPSERQIFMSRPPLVTTADPVGSRAAVRTGDPCRKVATRVRAPTSHTRAVPSCPAVTIRLPSAENSAPVNGAPS